MKLPQLRLWRTPPPRGRDRYPAIVKLWRAHSAGSSSALPTSQTPVAGDCEEGTLEVLRAVLPGQARSRRGVRLNHGLSHFGA